MNKIDFIGDIHGYADKLKALLLKMGYEYNEKNGFQHSERKVIFVGDYIDRGAKNFEVVNIVRKMVESGNAIALCGNHEHNAICFNTKIREGYLRKHSIKNFVQHASTLIEFQGKQKEYDDMIAWFKTLPLYYETDQFRVVHASWDDDSIEYLRKHTNNGVLTDNQYQELINWEGPLNQAIEIICKGKEKTLPHSMSFKDKDGAERTEIRIKWWLNPQQHSLKELSIIKIQDLSDDILVDDTGDFYKYNEKPVFFGHYWLEGSPELMQQNVCCLDYSVAKKGLLCAYRYNGENKLTNDNFVWV